MYLNKYSQRRINQNKKWWFRYIRGMNLWTFRFWWLFWLILTAILFLLYLYCPSCELINSTYMNQCPECPTCPGTNGQYGLVAPSPSDSLTEMTSGPTLNCGDSPRSASGAYEFHVQDYELGENSGNVVLSFDTYNVPDEVIMEHNGKVVFRSGNVSTQGMKQTTWRYVHVPNQSTILTVKIRPSQEGTQWQYNLGCPQ